MSYGSDMKAVVSPFAAACTAVTQLAVSLLTEECAMSEYIESLTKYASNACTEVLSGIEHQLERTLQGPCEKVAEKVARLLTEESDPSALSKVDGVSRAALGLLQEASPALASAKEGLEKLGRFLEKVRHCHLTSRPMADQLGGTRDYSLGCALHAPFPMPDCRFCGTDPLTGFVVAVRPRSQIHHMLKALASPKQLVGQLAERALLWAIERLQRKCAEIEERLQRKCAEIAEIAEIGALPTVKTVVEKLLHYAKALSSLGALRKGFEMAIFGCMAGGDTGLQSEMGKILRAVGEKLRGALQQIVVKIVFFVVPVDCSKVAEMKVGALREALAQRGLSTDGKRKELQERLLEALEATPAVPTPSKDGADGDSTEGAEPPCVNDALKIVSFDGDSTEGAEPPSVNDAVRLLNDVANFITQGVDKSSIAEANELIQMLDKEVKELVQILGPESVGGAMRLLNNVANFMTQGVDKSEASIAEANELIQMLEKEVEKLVQILGPESIGGAMKAMREAIEKAMRDALEKAMREAMESTVLSGAGQTARTPQEGGVAAVDEALQLLTMLAHRTGSACAALKKAVRLTKHVSEAILSAQLPDLQVAGNAAITSALLAYKKDATEAQHEELRESARAKIEAYARSLDTLLEDLNKQQVASCQAAPRLTQRKTPANPSLTIPSPLLSFNPSSPLSPQLVETIRSVREAMLPEPKELSELSDASSSELRSLKLDVLGEVKEAFGKSVEGLKLQVLGELAEEAKTAVEDMVDAASNALDELDLGGDGDALGGAILAQGKALMGSLMARASEASLSDMARAARIREVAVAAALRLRRALSLLQVEGSAALLESMTQELVTRHVYESDKRVKALLGCKSKGPSEAELAHAWEAEQRHIKLAMQTKLKELEKRMKHAEEEDDPFRKQLVLNECRAERQALAMAAKGCGDLGEKLNVVLDFLVGFQDELAGMSSKLDAVQGSVAALQQSLERKLGRPVLDVLQERIEQEEHTSRLRLEDVVYIPARGVVADERGKFEVGVNNPAFELLGRDCKVAPPHGLVSFLTREDVEVSSKQLGGAPEAAHVTVTNTAPMAAPEAPWAAFEAAAASFRTSFRKLQAFTLLDADAAPGAELNTSESMPEARAEKARADAPVDAPTDEAAPVAASGPAAATGSPPRRSCLLIAGAAGSGKSTFLKKLLAYLRTEYRELRKKKHPQLQAVVILLVPLGSLVNPMTDLWAEGLKKQYGLTQAQCDELREHVRKGEAEVLFLLDAYDELSASTIGKSLYQANNLEQYRSDEERKANVHSNPVVIYTCRSETLDGVKGGPAEYEKWFLPLAADNEDMDEETEARPYFSQVRIARVDDKVQDYFAAHAALEARKAFERKYGPIPPSNRDVEPDEESFEKAFGGGPDRAKQLVAAYRAATVAAQQASTAGEVGSKPNPTGAAATADAKKKLQKTIKSASELFKSVPIPFNDPSAAERLGMVCLFATLRGPDLLERLQSRHTELASQYGQGAELWSFAQYREAFEAIPELKELVRTPFMQQVRRLRSTA